MQLTTLTFACTTKQYYHHARWLELQLLLDAQEGLFSRISKLKNIEHTLYGLWADNFVKGMPGHS